MKRISLLAMTLAGVFLAAVPASAETITGLINFTGSFIYDNRLDPTQNNGGTVCGDPTNTNTTCGNAVLDFAPAGGGSGQITTVVDVTEYFADMPAQNDGSGDTPTEVTILDLNNFEPDPGSDPSTYAPTGVALTVDNFLSDFTSPDLPAFYDGLHFDLTEVVEAEGDGCGTTLDNGESCVLGPFTLTQTALGLIINFEVLGWFRNPESAANTDADEGFYRGTFSVTLNSLRYNPTVFDRLTTDASDIGCGLASGWTQFCSFGANFNPEQFNPVPEPATLGTLGVGILLAGAAYRRRQKRAQVQ